MAGAGNANLRVRMTESTSPMPRSTPHRTHPVVRQQEMRGPSAQNALPVGSPSTQSSMPRTKARSAMRNRDRSVPQRAMSIASTARRRASARREVFGSHREHAPSGARVSTASTSRNGSRSSSLPLTTSPRSRPDRLELHQLASTSPRTFGAERADVDVVRSRP